MVCSVHSPNDALMGDGDIHLGNGQMSTRRLR